MFVQHFESEGTRQGHIATVPTIVDNKEAAEIAKVMRCVPDPGESWILNFEFLRGIHHPANFFEMLRELIATLEEKGVAVRIVMSPQISYNAILRELFPGNCFPDEEQAILSFMPAA